MSVPLSALLAHPDLAGVVVLAGEGDPEVRGVHGVLSAQTRAGLPAAVRRGDLLVLLDDPHEPDWRFDALLRRAVAIGVPAVVRPGSPVLDRGTVVLAERLGIMVLGCRDAWQASVIARDLVAAADALSSRAAVLAAHVGQSAGESLDELLASLTASLKRSVLLLDAVGGRVGGLHAHAGMVDQQDDEAITRKLSGRAVPTTAYLPSGGVLLASPVTTGYGARLWVAAVLAVPLPSEQAALAVALDVASVAVGHRLALRRMADERDARHRVALLGELVDGAADVSAALSRRTLDAGWVLDGWHIGIRVTPRDDVDLVARRDDVVQALEAEGVSTNVVEQADGWVAWTTLVNEPTPADVERLGAAIRRAQRQLEPTLATQVGVGRARAGAAGIAQSLAEASDAARLAAARPHTGRFLHVDRLGLAQLLLAWTRTDTFQPAALELLAPLRGLSGDLLTTLTAYLDAESSLAETAAVLGVHRNTVAGRVARIQRLLSVDLSDAETRLALHLACRTVALG